MSEPRIIKQLAPHEIEALIKARKEAEAAREVVHRAALPIEEVDTMPRPEDIPQIIKQLEPHEIEALIKTQKEAEAAREAARLAALPVKEYDPMPGPEGIPKVIYEGKEVPYLSLYPAYPEHKYGLAEEPLVFEMGDPRAATGGYPQTPNTPPGDAELPPGYPGRLRSPYGQYAVSVLPSGAVQVTRAR